MCLHKLSLFSNCYQIRSRKTRIVLFSVQCANVDQSPNLNFRSRYIPAALRLQPSTGSGRTSLARCSSHGWAAASTTTPNATDARAGNKTTIFLERRFCFCCHMTVPVFDWKVSEWGILINCSLYVVNSAYFGCCTWFGQTFVLFVSLFLLL